MAQSIQPTSLVERLAHIERLDLIDYSKSPEGDISILVLAIIALIILCISLLTAVCVMQFDDFVTPGRIMLTNEAMGRYEDDCLPKYEERHALLAHTNERGECEERRSIDQSEKTEERGEGELG